MAPVTAAVVAQQLHDWMAGEELDPRLLDYTREEARDHAGAEGERVAVIVVGVTYDEVVAKGRRQALLDLAVGKFAPHRDTEDPLHFVMIEAFPDEAALEARRETDFYRELMAEIPDLIVERRRTVLAPLGYGEPERGYLA